MRLGADPEVFLKDRNNKHLSVIGMIGAGKEDPLQVVGMPKGFTLQEDNVALEFGQPPAATADEFVFNTRAAMLAGLSTLKGKRFSRLSCTVFEEDQMKHPMAHIFGCEPDYDAYTGKKNEKPTPPHPFMRSAGGHVHVEMPKKTSMKNKRLLVRAMDLYLGVPSVLLDDGQERRQLYGQAGCFRYKPYGVEYRTLSNFWIFKKKYTKWVWSQTEKALEAAKNPAWDTTVTEKFVKRAINTGDKKAAQFLVTLFNLELV
jgi:hypothetical protein